MPDTIEAIEAKLEALRAQASEDYTKRQANLTLARAMYELFARTDLAQKYGVLGVDFAVLVTPAGDGLAVKRPSKVAYQAFVNAGGQPGAALYDASYALVRSCLIDPDPKSEGQKFEDILTRAPNAIVDLADMAADLAGARAKRIEGK